MGKLITPWHGAHDIRGNRSQLVPTEFKSGASYVKHTITLMCLKYVKGMFSYNAT